MEELSIKKILSNFILDESIVDLLVNDKTISEWKRAFVHESVNFIHNYERLEFLGDSLLHYSFCIYMTNILKISDSGRMNNIQSFYMSKHYQPIISKNLGLDKLLRISPDIKVTNDILEDIFEAFFGAFDKVATKLKSLFPDIVKSSQDYVLDFFIWYFSTYDTINLNKEINNKTLFEDFYYFFSGDSPKTKNTWYYNSKNKSFFFNSKYINIISYYDKSLASKIKLVLTKKGYPSENEYINEVIHLFKSNGYDITWLKNEKAALKFDESICQLASKNGLTRFKLERNSNGSYDLLAQKTHPKTKVSISELIKSFDITNLETLKEKAVEIIKERYI